jgi:coatomer protein complex subunit alpha (xenin)
MQHNCLNQSETNLLIWSKADGGSYELVTMARGGTDAEPMRGTARACVFVARNRFAVLDRSRSTILIKNMNNEMTKKFDVPIPSPDNIYFAGTVGRLLIAKDDRVYLYENNARRILSDVQAGKVKYVFWNSERSLVALMSKHGITICDKQLNVKCTVTEAVRVKSGAFDENNIFVYTTSNHINYCLDTGDHGMICTLDNPMYVSKIHRGTMYCLDRDCATRSIKLDMTEAKFKLALAQKRYEDVMKMVKHSRLCGQAILAYLQKKGAPQVALYFVEDHKTRFDLALECGNIKVAMESASEIDTPECWEKLGTAALQQGKNRLAHCPVDECVVNLLCCACGLVVLLFFSIYSPNDSHINSHSSPTQFFLLNTGKSQVVEKAYQRCQNFDGLSFHYLVTGNRGHLSKMLKIAQHRKNRMSRYHNALYLGDVEERVRVLEEVGQYALAYVTAATNGLHEDAERLSKLLSDSGASVPTLPANPELMMPPTPIQSAVQQSNWPEVEIERDVFAEAVKAAQESQSLEENPEDPGWEDENLDADMLGKGGKGGGDLDLNDDDDDMDLNDGDGWGDDDDLGLGDSDEDLGLGSSDEETGGDGNTSGMVDSSGFYVPPNPGRADSDYWTDSPLAADHIAAGSFSTGMKLLNRQIGAVNFAPMKASFLAVSTASKVQLNGLPSTAPIGQYILRNGTENGKNSLPRISITLASLISDYRDAKKMFGKNLLDESLTALRAIFGKIPLLVVNKSEEDKLIRELLGGCREYVTGIRLEQERRKAKAEGNTVRSLELNCYFTTCGLDQAHLALFVLKTAMLTGTYI